MFFVVFVFFFIVCGEDEDFVILILEFVDELIIILWENIIFDVIWEFDKIYVLGGCIIVEFGVILMIQLGIVIKVEVGIGVNVIVFFVVCGGMLIVEGMVDVLIIFIFIVDEIMFEQVVGGDFVSLNFDLDINGFWGGVIVLGSVIIFVFNEVFDGVFEDLSEV